MFSVYCGLALHHAKLYDKIRRSEQKYKGNNNYLNNFKVVLFFWLLKLFFFKVALEVLSYHNASSANEVDDLVTEGAQDCDEKVARYGTFHHKQECVDGFPSLLLATYTDASISLAFGDFTT